MTTALGHPVPQLTLSKIRKPKVFSHLNMLVYGGPDAGKTWLVGSAEGDPRFGRILMINTDQGDLTLSGKDGIDIVDFTNPKIFLAQAKEIITHIYKGKHPWGLVAVDSVGPLHALLMRAAMGPRQADKGFDVMLTAEQSEWGLARSEMLKFLCALRDAPIHLLVLAEQWRQRQPTGGMAWAPKAAGQLADDIPHMFEIMGHLAVRTDDNNNEFRQMRLKGGKTWLARSRSQYLQDPHINNPTLPGILDLIQSRIPDGGDSSANAEQPKQLSEDA